MVLDVYKNGLFILDQQYCYSSFRDIAALIQLLHRWYGFAIFTLS